ncbi:MAG: Nif3-like dinuclear metal center hexameric protein [Pirellula sp.]|nr:Nif3-like dinuclear metal center hexameric protein [Pirellula sp.]
MQLDSILTVLQEIAPLEYAENWDNVGLLAGHRGRFISSVMTCLTLTSTTLQEAIDVQAGLVVCHHPIPFKPLSKITSDTTTGKLLLDAMEAGIAIYSPHTAWDNARTGINQQLADMIGLTSIQPLQAFSQPKSGDETVGVGRYGIASGAETTIGKLLQRIQATLPSIEPRHTHRLEHLVSKIGIVCGSGGSMLALVASRGCDAMLTGEATYHQCLEAESLGIAMLMIGHHASEAFAMKSLASQLQTKLPSLWVVSSQKEASRF